MFGPLSSAGPVKVYSAQNTVKTEISWISKGQQTAHAVKKTNNTTKAALEIVCTLTLTLRVNPNPNIFPNPNPKVLS